MVYSRLNVPLTTKLSYALGGVAEGSVNWAFTGFNFIVYTIGFGMPGVLVGLAVSLSIVVDAITDPLIGYLSDRWLSPLGRRHPFIYFSAIPLGACVFCIYVPPDVLLVAGGNTYSVLGYEATSSQWALFGWLFVFASLLKFFLTCYHLPHLALGSELTDDYLERTRIFRYNTLFSFSGGAVLAWFFYNVFFPEGPFAGMDLSWFAGFLATFGAIIIFLTAWLTRSQIPYLPKASESQQPFSVAQFLREAAVVFTNRNYMMLFYGLLCLSCMTGVRETLSANIGLYYWEFPPGLIGILPFFGLASYFVGMAIVASMNQRLEKGGTMRLVVGAAMFSAAFPVICRSVGIFPDNGSPFLFPLIGAFTFVYYGSLAILATTVYSAIGDVVDEQELHSGVRQEGVFYSVRTFFAKVSNAIGHLLAGIAIDVIGFPPNAVVGEVNPQVIFELGIFEGVIASLPVLGAIYFYGQYKIDKKHHQQIVEALKLKRQGSS